MQIPDRSRPSAVSNDTHTSNSGPFDLAASARGEMVHEGFHLGDAPGGEEQLAAIRAHLAQPSSDSNRRDLRSLLWSSIDNDTSRDLDQVEYAERAGSGVGIKVLVAVADVASAIDKGTPLDLAAADQTQTVYTAVHNFPMLPNELSTDLTSLNENVDRAAMVVEFTVDEHGLPTATSIYPALVRNQAQLAYSTTGAWLEGKARSDGRTEPRLDANPALGAQLRLQDEAAQRLHKQRVALGALDFKRTEADPVVIDGKVQSIQAVTQRGQGDLLELVVIIDRGAVRIVQLLDEVIGCAPVEAFRGVADLIDPEKTMTGRSRRACLIPRRSSIPCSGRSGRQRSRKTTARFPPSPRTRLKASSGVRA